MEAAIETAQNSADKDIVACCEYFRMRAMCPRLGQRGGRGEETKAQVLRGRLAAEGTGAFESPLSDPHDVVAVLKFVLREKPGGLCGALSSKICDAGCVAAKEATQATLQLLRDAVEELPVEAYSSLVLVVNHLAQVIQENALLSLS